jgi:hypothetical protein
LTILGVGGCFYRVIIGDMSIYGRGIFPLPERIQDWSSPDRLVAILDLASDCLGCSQLIIRLDNSLEDTCTLSTCLS